MKSRKAAELRKKIADAKLDAQVADAVGDAGRKLSALSDLARLQHLLTIETQAA